MDTSRGEGTGNQARTMLVAMAVLLTVLVAALAVAPKADAHETTGTSTAIFVDGNLVKRTADDHFTYSKIRRPGCHTVKVVSITREDGETERVVQKKRTCLMERAKLTVRVSDGSVSSSVTTNY